MNERTGGHGRQRVRRRTLSAAWHALMALSFLAGAALASGGCERGYTSPMGLPTVAMQIGRHTYTLEVAKTEAHRRRGLMMRDSIPERWGMIFVFPDEDYRSFWMKNTRIPLDIVYLDAGGRVVSIHRMLPHVETGTWSEGPAKYAIELNAGQAEAAGVRRGDMLVIPAEVGEAVD